MEQKTISVQQYTPDVIARNIKRVREGVVEIKRYSDSGIRYLVWTWFIVILFYWIWNIVDPEQDLHYIFEWIWNASQNERQLTRLLTDPSNPLYTRDGQPIEDYQRELSLHVKEHIQDAWILLSVPLWLFLLASFPRWRPLRIDTKRRLVYFWLWGQFYITRYPKHLPLNVLYSRMHQPKLRLPEHAALVLKVPHESKVGKFTEVDLGIFRPACNYQNYVLYNFLQDYLTADNPEQEFARYFEKENTLFSDYLNRFFYRFSLFPDRGYNEKKTEAKIQAWLATHPESNDDFWDTQGNLDQLMRRLLEK